MRRLASVLIVVGILVAAYPLAQQAYTWYWQQRYLAAWEKSLETSESEDSAQGREVTPSEESESDGPTPIGVLVIDKINLRLPILDGMGGDKLWIGAGVWEEGAAIGEEGNTVIASHHVYKYGQLFNRLDEVQEGDEVVIETRSRAYRYVVYDRVVVSPEALTFEEAGPGELLLTLVTCEYSRSRTNPDRLVVKARSTWTPKHG